MIANYMTKLLVKFKFQNFKKQIMNIWRSHGQSEGVCWTIHEKLSKIIKKIEEKCMTTIYEKYVESNESSRRKSRI